MVQPKQTLASESVPKTDLFTEKKNTNILYTFKPATRTNHVPNFVWVLLISFIYYALELCAGINFVFQS